MIDSFKDIQKELLTHGITVHLSEGKYLFEQNEIPNCLFFVVKGEVLFQSADGSKKIIPNQSIYGLRDLLLGEPYDHAAITVSKTKLVVMEKGKIFSILTKHRRIVFQYIFSLSKKEIIYE
jgi:CRP-like cAMP-binding protein